MPQPSEHYGLSCLLSLELAIPQKLLVELGFRYGRCKLAIDRGASKLNSYTFNTIGKFLPDGATQDWYIYGTRGTMIVLTGKL